MQVLSSVAKRCGDFHPQKSLLHSSHHHCIRRAKSKDIEAILKLIHHYASKGALLSRERVSIAAEIESFFVVENEGEEVVGCGALRCWQGDTAEVRSLAVRSDYMGMGIGAQLIKTLALQACHNGKTLLFALTLEPHFFEKMGFKVVQKELFPQKIQSDCLHCKFQVGCQEVAVAMSLRKE